MFDVHGIDLIVLAVVLAWDAVLREYPRQLHPVVWLGALIAALERRAPVRGTLSPLAYGALLVTVVSGGASGLAWLALTLAAGLPVAVYGVVAFFLLKGALAGRALLAAAVAVGRPLGAGDLAGARAALPALVSRDPRALDAVGVASATVESVAENLADSVVAPLLFYLVLGVPGAVLYRAANTLDAMLGYRDPRYEYLGKAAARLDDLLNWVPARATALLVFIAALPWTRRPLRTWTVALRDHRRTASPNAGWPMAAMAGALGVELGKAGHYVLGPGLAAPDAEAVGRSVRIGATVMVLAAGLAVAVQLTRNALVS